MQVTVSLNLELPSSGDINELESLVLEAGRRAMVDALCAACKEYEEVVTECPNCHSQLLQSEGTNKRVVLCIFGRVELTMRRLHCEECGHRFRPADTFLSCLEGANVSAKLKQACVLAGISWSYKTAATVLKELCGAQISDETVRLLTAEVGKVEMQEQMERAEKIINPTASDVRRKREADLSQPISTKDSSPDLLMVGLDGGWVASRDQKGGMEGKIGVIASEVESIGSGRRRLSRRRYVATFKDSKQLGVLAYGAASELVGEDAGEQVVVGDGANWIKSETELHFPRAVKILDWPHLERAVKRAIRASLPGKKKQKERQEVYQKVTEPLWRGKVDEALEHLVGLRSQEGEELVTALEKAIRYVQGQRDWIGDYQEWQDEGYPIGSGLVERAVELVINRRLKRQGMRWCRVNADAVIVLRVRVINDEWEAPNLRLAA